MPSELEELVLFLHQPLPAVVQIALENLVGYSQGEHQKVFAYDNYRAITDLKELAKLKLSVMVGQAITILANLCDDPAMRDLISDDKAFLEYVGLQILDLDNTHADLMCILLTNMAKHDTIISILHMTATHDDRHKQVFKSLRIVDCLMDCFVKGQDRLLNKYANYDYLSYFFADFARFKEGCIYFVTAQEYDGVVPISKILVFTEYYDSKTRREGVASTIKNSLFETAQHMTLLTNPDINLLPYLLLPLAGPEPFDDDDMFNLPDELQLLPDDKKREPLPQIMCTHLESLLLLCTTREAREYLRSHSAYAVIKALYNVVNDENVEDLIDRLVQMLMRDDAPAEEEENDEDESDEDTKIVEVAWFKRWLYKKQDK